MNTLNTINSLIFDWDGTLADSAHLGLNAFQKTFADLDTPFPMSIYEQSYSPNWYTTYEALGLPREKWTTADELWLKHYGEQSADLIEGVGDTLLELQTRGYRLGVVSSGSESRLTREIQVSPLHNAFDVVICNEHIVNKKPHPEGLEKALRKLAIKGEQAAYVGDAPEDIQMAQQANVLAIGVRSNYPSSSRLELSSPAIFMESIRDLLDHFPARA
jgi:HAD superfamily hydrolase (TIGR01549 family)